MTARADAWLSVMLPVKSTAHIDRDAVSLRSMIGLRVLARSSTRTILKSVSGED